ncbi:hypothetical protein EPN87_00070 [archaeon]|nr:MAG: hypothetical protein EPN87_00070 [archaeon]
MTMRVDPKFTELSEAEKISGIVSGINNYFGKALTLYAMKIGHPYIKSELVACLETFLKEDLPFSRAIPHQYCRDSLQPIGAVTKMQVKKGDRNVVGYAKTGDGEIYGDPSIARFLSLAEELDMSLNKMNGGTSAHYGTLRHGYVLARVLEELNDGERHTQAELSKKIGVSGKNLLNSLPYFDKIGFITYESVKIDSWGTSERGYSSAHLVDIGKLEYYIENPKELRKDVADKRSWFTNFGHLTRALQLKSKDITYTKLEENLRIPHVSSNIIVSLLCDLGIYEYKYIGGRKRSSVKITSNGLRAFELAYQPALRACREPDSRYVKQEYREVLENLTDLRIHEMFRQEKMRYIGEKQSHNVAEGEEKDKIVLMAAKGLNTPVFRPRHIQEELARKGVDMKRATINLVICRLAESGEFKRAKKGFYSVG